MSALSLEPRKHPEFVKVAQISDLHFDADTRVPLRDRRGDAILELLLNDLLKERPDVLVVTGDIADSPADEAIYREWLSKAKRLLGRSAVSFRDLLLHTWGESRSYFLEICRRCEIDSARALFVLPGNHDYRVQGMGPGIPDVEREFRGVFGAYFRNAHLAFGDGRQPAIGMSIVTIDSNPVPDEHESLATGLVRTEEISKLRFLSELPPTPVAAAWFRVCLLHHHPLPVVPAEVFNELRSDPSLLDRIRGVAVAAFGAQTTLLRNAGAFLAAALSSQVDLVLHGHEHRMWVSELRYPAADDFHRMLVAAAGSAHRRTGDVYTYNTVKLYCDGRIEISQRCLETNQFNFVERSTFPRYDEGSLRIDRQRRRQRELLGCPIRDPALPTEQRYGRLRARRVARTSEIQADGNVVVTQSFDDLRATETEVRYYPLTTHLPGGYMGLGQEPEVTVRSGLDATGVGVKVQRHGDYVVLMAEFTPPLTPARHISFDVRYRLCNAFEFVTEYRRARCLNDEERGGPLGSREAVTYRARILFPDRYEAIVTFPEGLAPNEKPAARVLDASGSVDPLEHAYCNDRLRYFPADRTAVLSIDATLPDVTYEVSWPLLRKADWDRRFDRESLRRVRTVSSHILEVPFRERLAGLLGELRDKFCHTRDTPDLEEALMDEDTELTLFLVRQREQGTDEARWVSTSLVRCARLHGGAAPEITEIEVPAGVGVVGQAYRTRTTLYDHSEGRSGLYQQGMGEREVHAFLCCIPLPALGRTRGNAAARSGREATYGILSIGSYRAGSGLEQLVSSEDSEITWRRGAALTDWVQGNFAATVLETVRSR